MRAVAADPDFGAEIPRRRLVLISDLLAPTDAWPHAIGGIAGNGRAALALGYGIARAARLDSYSTRAMTFEVGIRNAGLGLLIVFAFFDGLGGMAIVAAWWGIWDIIAGLAVATWWARRTPDREEVLV